MPTLLSLNARGSIRDGFVPFVCGQASELGSGRPQDAPTLIRASGDQWLLRVRLSEDLGSPTAGRELLTGIRSLAPGDFRLAAQLLPAPPGLRLDVRAKALPAPSVVLHYYSTWPRARVRVRHAGDETVLAMTQDGNGPTPGEMCWVAEIPGNLCVGDWGFAVEGPGALRDEPADTGLCSGYQPRGTSVHLRAGEFFSAQPPRERRDPQVVSLAVPSPELRHDFVVHLVLPRDFGVRSGTYPVVVLNDGQNQIAGRGLYGGWHIDTTAASLTRRGRMRESILAAVEMHPDRDRAYLPPGGSSARPGQADAYTDFLADRLLPLLEEYHHADLSEGTTIIGASKGAIHGLYAALYRPESFTRVGCLSYASLQPDSNRAFLSQGAEPLPERVYLDSGTRWAPEDGAEDSDDNSLITHALRDDFLTRGMVLEQEIRYLLAYGDAHQEPAWRRRVTGCLEFLLHPE